MTTRCLPRPLCTQFAAVAGAAVMCVLPAGLAPTGGTTAAAIPGSGSAESTWAWLSAKGGPVASAPVELSHGNRYLCFLVQTTVAGHATNQAVRQDLKTGRRILVSVSGRGASANADVSNVSMSDDGRFVAFQTSADNLVAADSNRAPDVFVRDLLRRTTTRVSLGLRRTQLPEGGTTPVISGDGGTVIFQSTANIFRLPEAPNGSASLPHLYAFVRSSGRVDLVSGVSGAIGDTSGPDAAAVSRTGRYVAFISSSRLSTAASAPNDIYLKDRRTGGIALVTGHFDTATSGITASSYLSLSMDENARWLVFHYNSQGNGRCCAYYLIDLRTGRIVEVDGGSPASAVDPTSAASVDAEGTHVIYAAGGAALVSDSQRAVEDSGTQASTWYVRNLKGGNVRAVAATESTQDVLRCSGSFIDWPPVLAPDGSRVALVTTRPLDARDTNCSFDLYLTTVGE